MRTTAFALAALLVTTPLAAGSIAVAQHAALCTSSPLATQIGLNVMRRGGTASDAAVAVAFALAVADGSLAGGGFLVFYEAATRSVWALDFHAPGYVAGLTAIHGRFGKLPWKELLAPAIKLAAEKKDFSTALQRIADKGSHVVYDGDLSPRVVQQVTAAGGKISLRELREYAVAWRAPIKVTFHDYDIFTPPPPSAGGLMIAEELNILAGFDLKSADAARRIHLIAEAARRAALDRDRFAADSPTVRTTYRDVVSAERADHWRSSINPLRATPTTTLGEAPHVVVPVSSQDAHFSIVDAAGNIAAVTLTLDGIGGAGKQLFTSSAPAIVLRRGEPYLALGTSGGSAAPNFVLQTFLSIAILGRSLADAVDAPRFDQQSTPEDIAYENRNTPADIVAKLREMGHGLRETVALGDMNALMLEPNRITAVADPRRGGAAGGF